MSGLINKAKEKIAEMKADHNTSGSTNAGPHDSNMANKADPRIDSDLDGRGTHTTGTGVGGTHTTGTGVGGTHTGTGIGGTHTGTGVGGTHSGSGLTGSHQQTTAGPHSSNMANKADPRVDSDLSGGHVGSNPAYTGTGTTGTHSGIGSTHPATSGGITGSHNTSSTTAGPHSSDMMNKLDPRVDSDLSGGHPGSNQQYTHTGTTGSTGTSGFTSGTSTTHGSTNAGPHNSNIANKADPRVDSDLDGGRHAGLNQTTGHHGTTGLTSTAGATGHSHTAGSTNAGPHNSNFANSADPRVDSDLDGSRNAGLNQTTGGYGQTGTTGGYGQNGTTGGIGGSTSSGPVHNSNLLNKLDPRVDSDADGSRNAGMSQTSTTHNVGGGSTY